MSIIIKLQDIDEAIENLRYKSETTLKAKLLRAVRQYYSDDAVSESLSLIDTEELVKTIWDTGDDRELLKAKRKNFSSVKSGVNTDLKKLYADGKNPQGIVIGQANTFVISDEAKDKALSGIMDAFKEKGIDTTSKITDILSALGDVLSTAVSDAAAIDAKDEIDRLKEILGGISEKLGLSPQDLIRRAEAAAGGALQGGGKTTTGGGEDLSGYIRDGVSMLDKELHGLTEEAGGALESAARPGMKESLRQALADIIQTLKDPASDMSGKAGKIMAAVEQILSDAMDSAGEELSSEQASQLSQIFADLREGAKAAVPSELQPAEDQAVSSAAQSSGADLASTAADGQAKLSGEKLLAEVASILGEGGGGAGDKIGRIMAAVNDMIGEALANSGLSGEEVAQIQEMMGNIAGNLEAFAHEALAEEDIIEEIIEDDTGGRDSAVEDVTDGAGAAMDAGPGESADEEVVPEDQPSSTDEFVEIIEEVSDEVFADAAQPEATAAGDAVLGGEGADFTEEAVDEGYDQAGLTEQDAASRTGGDECVEIIEEIVEEESGVPGPGAQAPAEDSAGEGFVEEIAGATEDMALAPPEVEAVGETAAGDGVAEGQAEAEALWEVIGEGVPDVADAADVAAPKAAEDQFIEVIEEVAGEDLPASGVQMQPADEDSAGETPTDETISAASGDAIVEMPEDISGQDGTLVGEGGAASGDMIEGMPAGADVVEEAMEAGAGGVTDEIVEVVEELTGEDAPETGADMMAEVANIEALEDALTEIVEVDEGAPEAPENLTLETAVEDGKTAGDAGVVEEIADSDIVEEIIEDGEPESAGVGVTPSDKPVDEELREKTDLLSRLAEAAGVLEKLGPDLSGSIYTEDELRGKAKFLSEEFDRYLSIRDKFFNAHILIKGGDYLVGGAHLAKSELEEQIVTLPDFYIGKFPVTNALFEIFVEQTGYVTTAEKYGYGLVYFPRMQRSRDLITGAERFTLHAQAYSKRVNGACWHRPFGPDSTLHLKRTHPVVQVSFEDARAYAAWTGKRLPTEIEWEASARTAQGLLFPWGNQWQEDACNTEKSLHGDTTPVDHYLKFVNAYEVADMLGNVLEWTMDAVGDRETSDMYIAKGASWISHHEISLADRHYLEKNSSSNILGFRCIAI